MTALPEADQGIASLSAKPEPAALPLMSAQLRFGLMTERSGRRMAVSLLFRVPSLQLTVGGLERALQALAQRNPALSTRMRFRRGTAYQEWYSSGRDVVELTAQSAQTASKFIEDAIEEFEADPDAPPVASRLIRLPAGGGEGEGDGDGDADGDGHADGDLLLLIFDHAVVDEESLLLIKKQLSKEPLGGAPMVDAEGWARYCAAVYDRVAFEAAADDASALAYWADRLGAVADALPRGPEPFVGVASVRTLPSVALPHGFRGSPFPYVLFSLHRAVQEITGSQTTVVGYAWGYRNPEFADVVGCFMNTLISLDTASPEAGPQSVGAFLKEWRREIDHADVPFAQVVGAGSRLPGSAWTGRVSALLTYEHAADGQSVTIAGVDCAEVAPRSSNPNASVAVGVVVRGGELELRIVVDDRVLPCSCDEFGARWSHWLRRTLTYVSAGA